jgi:DNA-directed RNA polymerase subunit M/transcription elongation factor TFIIS
MFEDGRMVDAGDLMRKADEDPASDEEFLGLVAPQRLVKIDEKTDEGASKFLGMTREELIEYHAEKEMNDEGDVTVDASGAASFSITMHQEESEDKFAGLDDEVSNGGTHIAECPKCGAEDVTGSTVELQTRAADESGTQVTKTSCGCTLRNYD